MKSLLVTLFLISGFLCNKQTPRLEDMYATCGTSYQTAEIFFEEGDVLTFNVHFVYFADSLEEYQVDYPAVINGMNDFFLHANIRFHLYDIDTIVSPEIKENMPSYVKNHFDLKKRAIVNDSAIVIYIYGNFQPYFPEDKKTIGIAGGIGSTFSAIRKEFLYGVTLWHELCHNFSLLHVDSPDDSGVGYSIYSGDKVCDTRAIDNLHEKVNSNCKFSGDESLTEEEKKVLICNIMSWNFIKCRGCLTEGQIRKIRFHIHESPQLKLTIKEGLRYGY